MSRRESIGLLLVVAAAAALRFVNLPGRGGWGSDQGSMLLDVWNGLRAGRLPEIGPPASVGAFHHGPMAYIFWAPPAWLGHGDPAYIVAETALLGVLVVPLVWWVARSIAGPVAGLVAAYLVAISASQISYSTFVWTPTLLQPGAALAILGTWQAWRSRDPRWWLVAALGIGIVAQTHIAGPLLAIPLVATYIASLRLRPEQRRRELRWGAAAAAVIALTAVPYLAYQLGHDFADVRGLVDYLGAPSATPPLAPPLAVFVVIVRLISWPLTGWPQIAMDSGFLPAIVVAFGVIGGLAFQLRRARRDRSDDATPDPDYRDGLVFVLGSLAILMVAGAIGLKEMSHVQRLPTEQYHAWADPLAIIAAGVVLGALWRLSARQRARTLSRALVVAVLVALTAWNAANWPPLDASDGGYAAARSAATRLESELNGAPVALESLFPPENTNAYVYPLTLDGITPVDRSRANVLVLYCDSFFTDGCQGNAEATWLTEHLPGPPPAPIDRIPAGPGRTLSVYRIGNP